MRSTIIKKFVISICFCILLSSAMSLSVQAADRLQQPKKSKPVVVIDPGHGGENQGTIENGYEEKQMTLITAQAMYDTLTQFDNVEVYLTRTDDQELSLKERAIFAQEVNADFLFSIHYNASADHTLYGSEVWVPLKAPYNNYGYQFGYQYLSTMQEKGLFIRGVKTRKNDKGTDYYGILRECYSREIPSAILEHCHVDEPRDEQFCDTNEKLIAFGYDDALAVAKYFGLKSSALGLNYSNTSYVEVGGRHPIQITLKDSIPPETCILVYENSVAETGDYIFNLIAQDKHSPLMYYDYSLDGGETYTDKLPWPGVNTLTGEYDKTLTLNIHYESGETPSLLVRAYNMYDLFTISNLYEGEGPILYGADLIPESEETDVPVESSEEEIPVINDTVEEGNTFFWVKVSALGILSAVILALLSVFLMKQKVKRK